MVKMITAGVDVGAKFAKIVILKDGQVIARAKALVGLDLMKSASDVFETALKDAGLSRIDIQRVVATGMGGNAILQKPPISADEVVSVVVASAAGAHQLVPTVKTVIDVGAEEGRGIKVEGGRVKDFVINERCAAGAGTFIEAMARALEVKVEDLGPMSLKSMNAVPMNAQCCVFAESEVVSLIHSKISKEDISKAIHDAIAGRISSMILRIGVDKDVMLIGGCALNPGFVPPLEKELHASIIVPEFPEYVSALGAAVIAANPSR
jgi:benzoyl-CoA reductase subunit D